MAKSRRSKRKKKSSGNSSGFGLFVLGIIIGTSVTLLYQGVVADRNNDIGSGIEGIITVVGERKDLDHQLIQDSTEEALVAPSLDEFDFHKLLTNNDLGLPQPRTEEPGEAEAKPEEQLQPAPAPEAKVAKLTESTTKDQTTAQPPVPKEQGQAALDRKTLYVLQVGSYSSFKDADRVKATLALQGLESFIQKVSIEERGDFFRVRVGAI